MRNNHFDLDVAIAKSLQRRVGCYHAARYLKRFGFSLEATMFILFNM